MISPFVRLFGYKPINHLCGAPKTNAVHIGFTDMRASGIISYTTGGPRSLPTTWRDWTGWSLVMLPKFHNDSEFSSIALSPFEFVLLHSLCYFPPNAYHIGLGIPKVRLDSSVVLCCERTHPFPSKCSSPGYFMGFYMLSLAYKKLCSLIFVATFKRPSLGRFCWFPKLNTCNLSAQAASLPSAV